MTFASLTALEQERDEALQAVETANAALTAAQKDLKEGKQKVKALTRAIKALDKPTPSGRTRVSSDQAFLRVKEALETASEAQTVAQLVETTKLNTPAVTKALSAMGAVEITGKKRGQKFTTAEKMGAAMEKIVDGLKENFAEQAAVQDALRGNRGETDYTGFGVDEPTVFEISGEDDLKA